MIKVKLFATLREGRGKEVSFEYSEDIIVKDITEKLNIHKDDIAILLVNGKDVSLDHKLEDGDTISIFPPVGGG